MSQPAQPEFKDKFIAFVDILGFKKLVEAAEAGSGMSLKEILSVVEKLGSPDGEGSRPSTCPESARLRRDIDFRLTRVSDSVVVSSEASPAGVINLVSHCWGIVMALLRDGLMCRGYITRGRVFHNETELIGSGYQRAYESEGRVAAFKREADERGTPFIEVDRVVCDYIRDCDDRCVKEMFSRYVRDDGQVVALYPFQRLATSFIIAGFGWKFDPERERQSNQNLRRLLRQLKDRVVAFVDASNPSAVRKAEHYLRALDAQLEVCDKTDSMIVALASPLPLPRLVDRFGDPEVGHRPGT